MNSLPTTGLHAIAAMSLNRVIGASGTIPWHYPEDFRWFKRTTSGHTVIMGRKTFESMGRPLPNRRNIVISRSGGYSIEGVEWVISPAEAVAAARCSGAGATWVIGGAEVYRQLLPQCDELYLTVVLRAVQGDIFFPEFEDRFVLTACVLESDDFRVYRYRARVAYDWRNVSSAA